MKITYFTGIVSLLVILEFVPSAAQGQQPKTAQKTAPKGTWQEKVTTSIDPFEDVRAFIRKQLVAQQVPSLAVAVARKGQILWEEGFGWADRENRIPATEHTMYSLASISKPFTATGLMILKEQGKIDLDRPLNDYLGEAKLRTWLGNAADATVRRVANHTSGLPLHFQFFFADEPDLPPSMEETIRRYGNLVTPPGESFIYSNLGYGILGEVLARISGQSYADFLRREVFLPLGLTHTSVDIGPGLEKYQAVRYGKDGLPLPFYTFDHPGASAIFSSVHDLVRFGLFHVKAHLPDQKAILPDRAIEEMQKPASKAPVDQNYGIGWFLGKAKTGQETIAHGGGMDGVSTRLYLIPSEQIVIAVLSNADTELPGDVFRQIFPLLLGDAARDKPQSPALAPSLPPFRPSGLLMGTWKGLVHTHKGDLPLTLTIHESGDVHAQLGDQLETVVNDVRFSDGILTGKMSGSIGTEDANRLPYQLRLSLKLRGDTRLTGTMVARSLSQKRLGNALSHWAELQKK